MLAEPPPIAAPTIANRCVFTTDNVLPVIFPK